jgi:hypothetical protein
MLKKLIIVALFATSVTSYAQSVRNDDGNSKFLIRSTLGSSGISKTISTSEGTFLINQSIGQASVIGTYSKNNYTIRQGFQQPVISAKMVELPEKNMLKANIYPNPFQQSINILFDEIIASKLSVSIYNLSGVIILNKTFPASQLLNIPLDFLPNGNYILSITSESKQLLSEIIKQ